MKILLLLFLTGTLTLIAVMAKTGAPLKTSSTPLGILNLEFAYDKAKTAGIISAWGSINHTDVIAAAKTNTYWDFLFLFFYSGFLYLACSRISANTHGLFAKAGILIARGAMLAGLLDIIENIGMLITLHGHLSDKIAFLTTFFSVIKWILALTAVLYVFAGLLLLVFQKMRK